MNQIMTWLYLRGFNDLFLTIGFLISIIMTAYSLRFA